MLFDEDEQLVQGAYLNEVPIQYVRMFAGERPHHGRERNPLSLSTSQGQYSCRISGTRHGWPKRGQRGNMLQYRLLSLASLAGKGVEGAVTRVEGVDRVKGGAWTCTSTSQAENTIIIEKLKHGRKCAPTVYVYSLVCEFVNILRSLGIDSKRGGRYDNPTVFDVPARQATQAGIDSGLHKRLQIQALKSFVNLQLQSEWKRGAGQVVVAFPM